MLGGTAIVAATLTSGALAQAQKTAPAAAPAMTSPSGRKPNILVIFGDDMAFPRSVPTPGLDGIPHPEYQPGTQYNEVISLIDWLPTLWLPREYLTSRRR